MQVELTTALNNKLNFTIKVQLKVKSMNLIDNVQLTPFFFLTRVINRTRKMAIKFYYNKKFGSLMKNTVNLLLIVGTSLWSINQGQVC